MKYTTVKRFIDIFLSIVLFIVLFPILLAVGGVVFLCIGRPIFFTQERPGLNEKIFKLYKFRTMLNLTDENGQPLPDECRVNRVGLFLRRSSMDELPALINVLKGEMSLVGPRPLLVEYLPLYSSEQSRRHSVRPGITGLAQVKGRNEISWEKKFEYDIQYVENISIREDIKIVYSTFFKVLSSEGISDGRSIGMTKFKGSHKE